MLSSDKRRERADRDAVTLRRRQASVAQGPRLRRGERSPVDAFEEDVLSSRLRGSRNFQHQLLGLVDARDPH